MSSNTPPSRDIKTQGIVLRRTNYGEADRILAIITPEGKMSVMARGVRKPKSRLAGGVEMFTVSEMMVHVGRAELGALTGARMVEHYEGIMKDYNKIDGVKRRGYITLSRLLMKVLDDNAVVVDHKNGNTMDNRKSNLRICTQEKNTRRERTSLE